MRGTTRARGGRRPRATPHAQQLPCALEARGRFHAALRIIIFLKCTNIYNPACSALSKIGSDSPHPSPWNIYKRCPSQKTPERKAPTAVGESRQQPCASPEPRSPTLPLPMRSSPQRRHRRYQHRRRRQQRYRQWMPALTTTARAPSPYEVPTVGLAGGSAELETDDSQCRLLGRPRTLVERRPWWNSKPDGTLPSSGPSIPRGTGRRHRHPQPAADLNTGDTGPGGGGGRRANAA